MWVHATVGLTRRLLALALPKLDSSPRLSRFPLGSSQSDCGVRYDKRAPWNVKSEKDNWMPVRPPLPGMRAGDGGRSKDFWKYT